MEWIQNLCVVFAGLFLVSLPFLYWWSQWRGKQKKYVEHEEVFLLLFLVRQKDTGLVHSVFFGEVSGVICPSVGQTRGRYENLSYMCPEYEYETVEGGLICPRSLHVKELHDSVGTWVDLYWKHRFEAKK